MSRKHVVTCDVCGRPVAKDAAVRLRVSGRRGPQAVDFVQTVAELQVCPACARTRRFRITAEPAPEPGPDAVNPSPPMPP